MKIYWYNGKKNILGGQIRRLRKAMTPPLNQRELAQKLQLMGFEFDRATINRIENGKRFVADYEVLALTNALGVSLDRLYAVEEERRHVKEK